MKLVDILIVYAHRGHIDGDNLEASFFYYYLYWRGDIQLPSNPSCINFQYSGTEIVQI